MLSHYVAEAHDPFNTTENFDGMLSNQPNVNRRFGTSLVDRYSLFFFVRPNDAVHVADPTDHAFEIALGAHSWLENILLADRRARRGQNDYTDEYYDRFYNQAGAILVRQQQQTTRDVTRAHRLRAHDPQVLAHRLRHAGHLRRIAQQSLGAGSDRGQWVVDLVRDASGHRADVGESRRAEQLA